MCHRDEWVSVGCDACAGQCGSTVTDWVPYGDTDVPLESWEPCEMCSIEVCEQTIVRLAKWIQERGGDVVAIAEGK